MIFLPHRDLGDVARVLDSKLLNSSIIVAASIKKQLVNAPNDDRDVNMWRFTHGNTILALYLDTLQRELYRRIATTTISCDFTNWNLLIQPMPNWIIYPWWWHYEKLFASHRSALLRRNYEHYSQFGWKDTMSLPIWWPDK